MPEQMCSRMKKIPSSDIVHPEITRLPSLTVWRRAFRWFMVRLIRFVVWLCTRATVNGIENVPPQGPMLVVSNHLGDADLILGLALSPVSVDPFAKADLYDFPIVGRLMDAYGVIWVHRGQPDRRALRAALDGLKENRLVAITPEGRESATGSLEEGLDGAAYLALKAGVKLLPVTFTGTENERIYGNMKKLRKTDITMTVGTPFQLEHSSDRRGAMARGTQRIMSILAEQLPEHYRGVYRETVDTPAGDIPESEGRLGS